jgi:hypothetical protein
VAAAHRSQAQRPPKAGVSYSDFPSWSPEPGQTWFRNHGDRPTAADRGMWWFGSSPATPGAELDGRFDLPVPDGTCYFADTPEAAVFERVGSDYMMNGWVGSDLVDGRVVSEVTLPGVVNAANVSAGLSAAMNGVTAELTTTSDYALTQAWAAQFWADGFDGIRYILRFHGGEPLGLALFGKHGVPTPVWFGDPSPRPMGEVLDAMGIEVVSVPGAGSVTIVDP